MRDKIRLVSTAGTGYEYVATKNRRTMTGKLEIKKFDPVARKHVLFVEKKISALQKLATPRKKNDAFSLPLVIAIWGKIRYSPVSVITTLDIQYKLFDTDGIPIRAEVGIELTEFDPTTTAENDRALPLQNPTSFTPKPEKMHLVQAGERLEQVAEEVYGSANEWRAIASANGITDPFQDFRGRPLIIPNKKELDNG